MSILSRSLIATLAAGLLGGLIAAPLAAASEPTIKLYPTTGDEDFSSIAVAPNGTVWWTGYEHVGELDPADASPGTSNGISLEDTNVGNESSDPVGMAAAPDGTLWFAQAGGQERGIDKLEPDAGNAITLVYKNLYAAGSLAFSPLDTDLWYAGLNHELNRLAAGSDPPYTENAPTAADQNGAIAATTIDSGGNVWFTESGGAIGEVKAGTTAITEYPVPAQGSDPEGIAIDAAGDVWFTESGTDKIGELIPSQAAAGTSAGITEYAVPPWEGDEEGEPTGITTAPDGSLWFAQQIATGVSQSSLNRIGKIVPHSGGQATFTMMETPDGRGPEFIAADKQGNIWYLTNSSASPSEIGEIVDAAPSGGGGSNPGGGETPKGGTEPSTNSGTGDTGTTSTTTSTSTGSTVTTTTTVVTGVTTTVHAAPPVVRPEGLAENLQCLGPPAQPCEIVLNLETDEEYYNAGFPVKVAQTARAKRKLHTRKVTIGHLVVKLTGGQSRSVTVKLDPTGTKLLKKFHRLPATLTISESSGAAKKATVAKSAVTFKSVTHATHKRR